MPHIVIKGPLTPEDICLAFEPTEFAEGDFRGKAEDCYLSQDKNTLLVRSLIVERGFVKSFYVRFSTKDDVGVTISLEQLTRPDVSDGVKRLLGLFAWKILQIEPSAEVAQTNMESFIKEP